MIEIVVHGLPIAQGSKRHVGKGVMIESAKGLKPWRTDISWAAVQAMRGRDILLGPVRVEATFTFPRPKSHYRTGKHAAELKPNAPIYHIVAPDSDKLARGAADALSGIIFRDDSQIADWRIQKFYGTPGMRLLVEEIE